DLPRETDTDHAPADRKHVCVVVLPAVAHGEDVGAVDRANARMTVGRHRHADASSADQDPAIETPFDDAACREVREIGVVARLGAARADVRDRVAALAQAFDELAFQLEAAVVRPEDKSFAHDYFSSA